MTHEEFEAQAQAIIQEEVALAEIRAKQRLIALGARYMVDAVMKAVMAGVQVSEAPRKTH